MKLIFITEARFTKDANGNIYGTSAFNALLWKGYLKSFSYVFVFARVKTDDKYQGITDDLSSAFNVSFIELPYYLGPFNYLKKYRLILKIAKETLTIKDAAFICRGPGYLSDLVASLLREKETPYGVEVVGDPWDVFARGNIKHPLRLFFRIKGFFDLKKIVRNASAALYVTKETLQKRYQPSPGGFQINCSNVKIQNYGLLKPKLLYKKRVYNLISIGSLEQMYKGPDITLKAIAILKKEGLACKLTWLGEGIFREAMEKMALDFKINEQVDFKGNVAAMVVVKNLENSDLFVLASRAEGLPRAVIEAMAVGLPCVATNVGGIPELLDKEVLVPKNNPYKLAEKIKNLLENPDFYNQQAQRNLNEALNYTAENLDKKRKLFYEYLINNRYK